MKESLTEANNEIKRADHLIYVSLKYTRTVDVIKNIIQRIINAYDLIITAMLKKFQDEGKIESIPETPVAKGALLKDLAKGDKKIEENVAFYLLLRKMGRAKYEKAREYRRHVTMAVEMDGESIEINIDRIHEYFDRLKDFFEHAKQMMEND